jgi:hypothetical protein
LSVTVAFLAMVTSGGEANMELQIGPFLKLEDSAAIFFSRSMIGFGVLMLILFIWMRRVGFALALIWSAWWGLILSTALLNASRLSERVAILITVSLFITSAWFALTLLRTENPTVSNQP